MTPINKAITGTRELLLDSAFNVFYKQGSMYYYFNSKKELALSVINEIKKG